MPRFVRLYEDAVNTPLLTSMISLNCFHRRGPRVLSVLSHGRSLVSVWISLCLLAGLSPLQGQVYLVDFGADGTPTSLGDAPNDPGNYWNNVPTAIGVVPGGTVSNLVSVLNEPSGISLVIIDRFNGANENGTTFSLLPFPENATRDSLYGNTEVWNGITDVYPKFKLSGLEATATYNLRFYASRMGATDNRETGYTITGGSTTVVTLNAAANADEWVVASDVAPDGAGEITIAMAPTENNNNGTHFTYLGVLQIEAVVPQTPIAFTEQPASQSVVEFRSVTFTSSVSGSPPYYVQWNANGFPIPGATQFSYTIPVVTPDLDGTQYSVTVSNLAFGATSGNATLTVTADTTAPAVTSVGSPDGFSVEILFDEAMDVNTIVDPAHYTVANAPGAPFVLGAELRPDGRTAVLTLVERLVGSFSVTVNNVTDLAGNPVAANTTVNAVAPRVGALKVLIDFGGTATEHGPAPDDPTNYWNNVDASLGATEFGELPGLVTAFNEPTTMSLVILSRFNGANASGTTALSVYPTDATRDSLFGNTEIFSGLENIFPSFKLTGLEPEKAYDLTFFASRTGVGDNRETGYTIVGAATTTVALDSANNVANTVTAGGVKPDGAGEITISLAPTENNNNGNHFTYLGVLELAQAAPRFLPATVTGSAITLQWTGEGALERASSVNGPWTAVLPAPSSPYTETLVSGQNRFYRIKQ